MDTVCVSTVDVAKMVDHKGEKVVGDFRDEIKETPLMEARQNN